MSNKPSFTRPIGLAIEPLDPLFFRDGRPFDAKGRGATQMPLPQTLYGMLKTFLLRQSGMQPRELHGLRERKDAKHEWISRVAVRGPWLARFQGDGGALEDVYTHPPAHLMQLGKGDGKTVPELRLLRPLPEGLLPGFEESNPCESGLRLVPLWGGDTKEEQLKGVEGRLLTKSGLQKVLNGDTPTGSHDIVPTTDLFDYEERIGIGVNPERQTAADAQIYSVKFLRLRTPEVGFYAEIGMEGDDAKEMDRLCELLSAHPILPFGGEGRRVRVRVVKKFGWPQCTKQGGDGFASLLVTPASWVPGAKAQPGTNPARWVPTNPIGALVAAAVPKPIAVSGWDMAGGAAEQSGQATPRPRPVRYAVPAGTVYFWKNGKHAETERPQDHLWQLAQTPAEKAAGWGLALRCRWEWFSAG